MPLFWGYGSEYRRAVLFQRLIKPTPADAFAAAVGGAFDLVGQIECEILAAEGLSDDDFLIDVGCGAGRLAVRLRDRPALRYLGVDVVPDLIDYARNSANRPDWRFELVSKTEIPCATGVASICAAFSLFTHVPEKICLDYLAEMRRALMPGGRAIFSFFDPDVAVHSKLLKNNVARRVFARAAYAQNVGYAKARVSVWAGMSGFAVRRLESPSVLGQSLAVFERADNLDLEA